MMDKPLEIVGHCARCGRDYVWLPDDKATCSLGFKRGPMLVECNGVIVRTRPKQETLEASDGK